MDIVVIFEKIALTALGENKEQFGEKIGEAGKIVNLVKADDEIHVQVLEGSIPNAMPKEKVAIIISSDKAMPNAGKLIVEFKQKVIQLFSNCGVLLDKDSLQIKMSPPYDVQTFISKVRNMNKPKLKAEESADMPKQSDNDEFDYEQKSKQYVPVEPLYSFDRVILPKEVLEKIEEAVGILQCENKVFNEWGLYEIQPHPSTSLSFYGPSGTGKTMAAEAIAHKLGKKILKVSYADVESKYHGEGPKMVKAIFLAAKNEDAVLFFDEADSLLSKRLTSVTQGSEQAINSMRSQLLICLEEFRGIVIFATNLVVNYDKAFLTRLISVEFTNPDSETRKRIWDVHVRPLDDGKPHQLNIPLADDVDTASLAEKYDFAGREIRNAVVAACVSAALSERNIVSQEDFVKACDKIEAEKAALAAAKDHTKSETSDLIKKALAEKIKQKSEEGEKNVSELTE